MSDHAAEGRLVKVYRSSRRAEMYLYVDAATELGEVPEALLDRFGRPVEAMTLTLTAERHLARAEAAAVLQSIETHGYYLQMPPPESWSRL